MKTLIQTRIGTLALTLALLGGLAPRAEATDKYWTGASGTGWNTGANWLPSGVPGSSDVAIFDGGTSSASCTMDANVSVAGMVLTNAYAGTVNQGTGRTVTIGSSNFVQYAGTFAGGDANITINGTFTLAGGAFTAPSGTLTVSGPNASVATIFTYGGGTFNHNNGTLKFDFPNSPGGDIAHTISLANTLTVNNLIFDSTYPGPQGVYTMTYSLSGSSATFVVGSNFTMKATIRPVTVNGGTIEVHGNVIGAGWASGGSSVLLLDGSGDQQYTWSGGELPYFAINKTNGTVTPSTGTTALRVRTFTLTQGAFTAPSGTLTVQGPYMSATIFTYSSGTFNHNNGTLKFDYPTGFGPWTHTISLANTLTVNNLIFDSTFSDFQGTWSITYSLSGSPATFVVGSNFTMTATVRPLKVNGGTIEVQKDITIGGQANGGSATLNLTGGNNQTITQTGGTVPAGTWTINKSGGSATLATDLNLAGSGQQLVWTNGALNLSSNTLTVAGATTIYPGATTLGVTVADTNKAGRLMCNSAVSGLANVGLEVSVTAAKEQSPQIQAQTYTILSNNTSLGVTKFESETWVGNWRGTVDYSANAGKSVTLSNVRFIEGGTVLMVQ